MAKRRALTSVYRLWGSNWKRKRRPFPGLKLPLHLAREGGCPLLPPSGGDDRTRAVLLVKTKRRALLDDSTSVHWMPNLHAFKLSGKVSQIACYCGLLSCPHVCTIFSSQNITSFKWFPFFWRGLGGIALAFITGKDDLRCVSNESFQTPHLKSLVQYFLFFSRLDV